MIASFTENRLSLHFKNRFACMFFFGLLSTNLPYILLGVVYLVTFASFSLKALEMDAMDQCEQQSKHIYLQSNNLTENTPQCLNFYDELAQQAIETKLIVSNKPLPPLLKVQVWIAPPRFLSQFIPHFLFSRPPPALV